MERRTKIWRKLERACAFLTRYCRGQVDYPHTCAPTRLTVLVGLRRRRLCARHLKWNLQISKSPHLHISDFPDPEKGVAHGVLILSGTPVSSISLLNEGTILEETGKGWCLPNPTLSRSSGLPPLVHLQDSQYCQTHGAENLSPVTANGISTSPHLHISSSPISPIPNMQWSSFCRGLLSPAFHC